MDPRQRIIEEASEMFRTYGIRAVTMDMLASEMGISKRTIYEIFTDKDELLNGVIEWMTRKQHQIFEDIMKQSENVIEAIFRMLEVMSEHYRFMSPAFKLDLKKYHNDIVSKIKDSGEMPYYVNNTDILLRGIREGIFRRDIDITVTNKCIMEVIRMSNDKEIFPPDTFNELTVVRDFLINYIRGICTQKGLDLIITHEKKSLAFKQRKSKTQ